MPQPQILPTKKGQIVKYFVAEKNEENMLFVVREIYTNWKGNLCVEIQCINSSLTFPPINSMDAKHVTLVN